MTPNLFSVPPAALLCQRPTQFSPLMLADRLITLAQEADRAGMSNSASRLICMAYAVLDDETDQVVAAA